MELTRKPFQGVLNILNFNRHFYYFGAIALVILMAVLFVCKLPLILQAIILLGFAYGLLMPLIVSAYVYDFSGYYNFKWLDNFFTNKNKAYKLVNIHAGFDETSFILKEKFPNAGLEVFDFYDEARHTEKAIIRAREVSNFYPGTKKISTAHIPLDTDSVDGIFFLSTIHEVRDHGDKVEFLKECKRALKPNGKLIVVEHLRDFPNFLAFTIGFTHFFSKAIWKRAFLEAGFNTITERKFTPFMSIFKCDL